MAARVMAARQPRSGRSPHLLLIHLSSPLPQVAASLITAADQYGTPPLGGVGKVWAAGQLTHTQLADMVVAAAPSLVSGWVGGLRKCAGQVQVVVELGHAVEVVSRQRNRHL